MTASPETVEKSGVENIDDSGFISAEAGSAHSDAEYNTDDAAAIEDSSKDFEKVDAAVPQKLSKEENDKAAERQRRMMSRIPQ